MSRWQYWIVLVITTGLALSEARGELTTAKKPNIILVLADDVGYEALGCYGGTSYATPHLDMLAQSGLQVMHCYSMPVCHPTRICLLSGKYPFRLANPKWGSYPKEVEQETFAWAMKRTGYRTAVSGKWQLSLLSKDLQQPQRMGFDQYCLFGWHEGPRYHEPLVFQNGKVNAAAGMRFGPDVYREFAQEFMLEKSDKPFFVFYSMALCHDVTEDLDAPVPVSKSGKYLNYHEMVLEMDRQMGLLIDFLDQHDLRKDTVVMFTTDNGTPVRYISHPDENGKYVRIPVFSQLHGKRIQGGKGRLDDTGTRVPLIVSWPGTIPTAQKSPALVDMSDFFATCVDLGQGRIPKGLDGQSFAPLLRGKGSPRTWVFAEHGGKSWVRDQQFKLLSNGTFLEVLAEPGQQRKITESLLSEQARSARTKLQSVQSKLSSNGSE